MTNWKSILLNNMDSLLKLSWDYLDAAERGDLDAMRRIRSEARCEYGPSGIEAIDLVLNNLIDLKLQEAYKMSGCLD